MLENGGKIDKSTDLASREYGRQDEKAEQD
jgi:hypothetical protein